MKHSLKKMVFTQYSEECGDRTDHQPKFARGEPCNVALIGHWDGWQPFGSPGQHSCGECKVVLSKRLHTSYLSSLACALLLHFVIG